MSRGQMAAVTYLASLKNYKLEHNGSSVELYHWGDCGWCSGGSYYDWESIFKGSF